MLICTMADSHLINLLNKCVLKRYELLLQAKSVNASDSKNTRFATKQQKDAINQLLKFAKTNEQQWIADTLEKYSPYILEGLRRDSTRATTLDIIGKLDADLGKPERIIVDEAIVSLPVNTSSYDDEDEDDDYKYYPGDND